MQRIVGGWLETLGGKAGVKTALCVLRAEMVPRESPVYVALQEVQVS